MKNVSTNKKNNADQAIKKTKVIGKPVDKHDFWFYAEGVEDEEGNPIVFNVNDDYEATPNEIGWSTQRDLDDHRDFIYYNEYDKKALIDDDEYHRCMRGTVYGIEYAAFDGKITYSMIDAYRLRNPHKPQEDEDSLDNKDPELGLIFLPNSRDKLTVRQVCWRILDLYGVEHPENLTVRILSGKKADKKFASRGKKE